MSGPKVLGACPPACGPHDVAGWGWLGAVLALAGMSDLVLLWIPLRFRSPEREFATIAATASALLLVSLGLAGMLAAAAGGRRWELR